MSIKLHLPNRFYYLWQGKKSIDVTGNTVDECLVELFGVIPLMKKALSYKSEGLDPEIRIQVNRADVGEEGLATKVLDGDEIHFVLGTA